jgi:hypothetical protein
MAKWKINVDLTVFTTVEAETKHEAYDAVAEEIKWLMTPTGDMYQINDFHTNEILALKEETDQ